MAEKSSEPKLFSLKKKNFSNLSEMKVWTKFSTTTELKIEIGNSKQRNNILAEKNPIFSE
ncbi:MAG: hypothetical protein V3U92_05775 [Cellulophaga sp.]